MGDIAPAKRAADRDSLTESRLQRCKVAGVRGRLWTFALLSYKEICTMNTLATLDEGPN
jgi:hypothetical protein